MNRSLVTAVLGVSATMSVAAPGEVVLSLTVVSPQIVLGVPVEVEIGWANTGPESVQLASGVGDVIGPFEDTEGFKRVIRVRRPDGTIGSGGWQSNSVPWRGLAPGQRVVYRADLEGTEPQVFTAPGRYEMWAEYESPGRVYGQGSIAGQPRLYTDHWKGRLVSGVCPIVVVEPEGADREAYERYEGGPMFARHLLREFPTSTYAAYRVREFTSEGLLPSDTAAIVSSLRTERVRVNRDIPCPPSVSPCMQEERRSTEVLGALALEWTAEWIGIVLRTHPDIWFADEMRLRLALDRYIAGDVAGAVAAMEALGKDGRPEVAAKAREVLALLRARGMIR